MNSDPTMRASLESIDVKEAISQIYNTGSTEEI